MPPASRPCRGQDVAAVGQGVQGELLLCSIFLWKAGWGWVLVSGLPEAAGFKVTETQPIHMYLFREEELWWSDMEPGEFPQCSSYMAQ